MIQNDVVSPTLNTNEASLGIAAVGIAFHQDPSLELTCHMGSHSVTCYPAEVTFQPLPQPKQVLDLATPKGCKVELT